MALQNEGWNVSLRKIERLCRQEGIHATQRSRKPRPTGAHASRSTQPGSGWCCDLLFDEDRSGHKLAWLAVLDECTRECLALDVYRRVNSREVIASFENARGHNGDSNFRVKVRLDNARVWRRAALSKWATQHSVEFKQSDRGSPWQNGVVESFFGRLRAELLAHSEFADLVEARYETALWRKLYNDVRPHSALGYRTPAAYRKAKISELTGA